MSARPIIFSSRSPSPQASVSLDIFDCFNAEEQIDYAARIWSTKTGGNTLTGRDSRFGWDHLAAADYLGEIRPEQSDADAVEAYLSNVSHRLIS